MTDQPAAPPTRAGRRRARAALPRTARTLLVLLALVTALVAELVRASGPLLDRAFSSGVSIAALTALVTYAAPGLAMTILVARLRVDGRVVLVGVGALVAVRIVLQVLGTAIGAGAELGMLRYGVGLAGTALGIAVLVLVAAYASGVRPADSPDRLAHGGLVAVGVTLGALLGAGTSLLLGTWDAVWRTGIAGWVVTVALAGAALALAWRTRRLDAAPGARGLWVLGPWLALTVMVLANPAFLASQSGVALPLVALALAASALLVGTAVTWQAPGLPGGAVQRATPWGEALVLVLGTTAIFFAPAGPALLGVAVVVTLAAARVVARALARPAHELSWVRLAGSASAVGLGTVAPLLVYPLDYDVPLPFPNGWVLVATALALGLGGVRGARAAVGPATEETDPRPVAPRLAGVWALAGAAALLCAVGATQVHVSPSASAAPSPAGEVRLLSWNLHYGVSAVPGVELDEMVRTIRDSGADVVALQEISRGWVLGGGGDMATALAAELDMHVVFASAADRQFGNALLWSDHLGELDDVVRHELPYGDGPQQRSAISGTLDVGGVPLRVTSVHLQHREENTPTRLAQLEALFAAEPVAGAYVLAGDLNAEPGWDELAATEAAGLTSGQDVAGDPSEATSPALWPRHRIDWVLGSRAVTFVDVQVLGSVASDHRALLATLRVTDG
ncbi:endonuclease/exonuclease/phosphatase family protein [Oerskovia flava]|uniref:endonuclease/exonuclease/phosphatase family protein n=1 Tax=Oerskovia flava TaxID=2986422 RepID=UPI0022400862|nr:endonuclease/exonuclease/phosphatase family protein [Oerskovia sp. JB1-3-2]